MVRNVGQDLWGVQRDWLICLSHLGRWWHCGSRKVVLRVIGHVGPRD